MAFKISNFTNPVAPSADYPWGDVADRSGSAGTRVNRTMLTDMLQFFQKLMDDAGITPNELSDNNTNGYQLVQALDARATAFDSTGITFATVASPWANIGAPYYNVGYKVDVNEISLCGVTTNPGAMPAGPVNIITLPADARPTSDVKVLAFATYGGGGSAAVQLNIAAATGIVSYTPGPQSSAIVHFDGVRYRKS